MTPNDINFVRWLKSSIYTYFKEQPANSFLVYVEEEEAEKDQSKSWCEIRVNGPRWREQLKGEYQIELEINIFCNALISNDAYNIDRLVGYIVSLIGPIEIKKYGDDDSFIGCIHLKKDVPNPVDVVQWGKPAPDIKIMQTSIDCYYEMRLP